MSKAPGPFDYIGTIMGGSNKDIFRVNKGKGYNAFLTARALSNHEDTIGWAALVNRMKIEPELHFCLLLNTVGKRKRSSRWFKMQEDTVVMAISRFYKCSLSVARMYRTVLNEQEIEAIQRAVS